MNTVGKVGISTTLTDPPWQNSRLELDPIAAVAALRSQPGSNLIVLSSTNIIGVLWASNELDGLMFKLRPRLLAESLDNDGLQKVRRRATIEVSR